MIKAFVSEAAPIFTTQYQEHNTTIGLQVELEFLGEKKGLVVRKTFKMRSLHKLYHSSLIISNFNSEASLAYFHC